MPRTQAGDPPFTLANLRKFDVGDRIEHTLHVQSNFILSPRSDLQFTSDVKSDAYDAQYGLRAATRYDLNAAFSWQLSTKTTFNVFYDFEFRNSGTAGINPTGGSTPDASAGGANYPLANGWYQKDRDLDHTVGATLHHSFDTVTVDLNYSFTKTNSILRYAYASTGAFFNSLTADPGRQRVPRQ